MEPSGTYTNHGFYKENVKEEFSSKITPSSQMDDDSTKTSALSEKERALEIRSIQLNVICVCLCTLLFSTPVSALVNSTSSLLDDEGLGITSLAASSTTQFLGSVFLLSYVNKVFGTKRMISITLMLPVPFIISFAYPTWGTTVPAGILLGLGQAFLSSSYMYGNAIGFYYADLTKGNLDTVLVAISGLMSICIGGGFLFGNIVVSAVLNIGLENVNTTLSSNVSYNVCGANYCNEELTNLPTMQKPELWRYYTMIGIFTAMSIFGGFVSLFIRDFSNELGQTLRKKTEYLPIMKETLALLKHPRGFLLVILTVFIGLEEAFVMADYTHAYVSCSIGIPKIGFIMMAFGGVEVIVCLCQGLFVKLFGRIIVTIFSVLVLLSCFLTLYLWQPDSNQVETFFVLVILWAAGDAILISTFWAIYGILFEDNIEGAMSLATFWWSFGSMIAFVWSQFLCISVKILICMAIGFVGLVCYLTLEVFLWKNSNKTTKTNNSTTDVS